LYQERWHGSSTTSRSRAGLQTTTGDPSTLASLIPHGSLHCPSSTFFASSQSQLFLIYSTSHSFTVSLISLSPSSIYWELALIYFKPGYVDHQTSLFLYCIAQLITLISAHDHQLIHSNLPTYPQREVSLSNFVSPKKTLRIPYNITYQSYASLGSYHIW
jgi:hypothetical protein